MKRQRTVKEHDMKCHDSYLCVRVKTGCPDTAELCEVLLASVLCFPFWTRRLRG